MATQSEYVVDLMRKNGGYLSLGEIYKEVEKEKSGLFDMNCFKTNIRYFIQREKKRYFRIKPGLWALIEYKDILPEEIKNQIEEGASYYDKVTDHSEIQANLISMGKALHFETYIFTQDNTRTYSDGFRLHNIVDTNLMPQFTYEDIIEKLKTIDVIWFDNSVEIESKRYKYPRVVFEVETTTDFKKSLDKFKLLKMFNMQYMYIVSYEEREKQFDKIILDSRYDDIRGKVKFLQLEDVESFHGNPKLLFKFDLI